jgi:hypothetical protein
MSIVTTQQLNRYYEQYRNTDVTFNRQVISAVGLVARGVYLKIQDRQLSCTVFSSSMTSARVVASVPGAVMVALKQVNNRLALRWCFKLPDKVEPMTFFVTCRPTGFTHYAVQGPDVHFITLEFTQRPPDDLILILGSLLEAKFNSQKRKDERVIVNPETMKKLGLETREAALVVEGRTCKCVLRDLSFSGARVVVSGKPATFADKVVSLRFAPGDQAPELTLPARVNRVDEVGGGRKEILTVSAEYTGEPPMSYKLLINSYVSTLRRAADKSAAPAAGSPQPETAEKPAPTAPASEAAPAPGPPVEAANAGDIPEEGDPLDEAGTKDPADG